MKRIVKKIFGLFGLSVTWKKTAPVNTSDISERKRKIFEECRPYTLISLERTDAIISAVDYLCQNNIPGDIVECGVWKGGSVYAAVKTLALNKSFNRKIYLFDVFDVNAMFSTTNEIAEDRDYRGITATDALEKGYLQKDNYNYQVDEVKALLKKTGYPMENIIFKIGRVEDTLPCDEIENIALLRLDTDWYDSTKHELETLYPKLVKNGVLLIDDYGYWQGCKKAVDEYFSQNNIPMFLHRTDFTGRSAIKI